MGLLFGRRSVGFAAALMILGIGKISTAQGGSSQYLHEITVGKPLFVTSATYVGGSLDNTYPFNPESYGKVRGYSPATENGTRVVIYTRTLDKEFIKLAQAIDSAIGKHKELSNALVIVMDEKGAQRGGYTVEELTQRRHVISKTATDAGIKNLGFFISAPGADSLTSRLGLKDGENVVITRLAESPEAKHKPVVKSITRLQVNKLTEELIKTTIEALSDK